MYLIGNESKRKVFVLGRGACTKNVLAALAGSKGTQIDRSGVVDKDLSPDFVFGQASGEKLYSVVSCVILDIALELVLLAV